MKNYRTVLIIGFIEILIGLTTIFCTFSSIALGINKKSPSVLLFVIIAALVSTSLGIGLLKFKKLAYQLLLYFSSVVVLSKIMIFLGVISLSGALETAIPSYIKDAISVMYHGFVIYYLRNSEIRRIFHN